MKFELRELPYKMNAFEPYISKRTFEFHHSKLQRDYINALNNLTPDTEFFDSDLETIIRIASGTLLTYASLVWNHTFYFEGLRPGSNSTLNTPFSDIIKSNFGTVSYFKKSFNKAAGSFLLTGWVWLVLNPNGSLEIIKENQAGNPLRSGYKPLLNCDMWEHAYYLDYQNRRQDYLDTFWRLVNWEIVEHRYRNVI